MSTTSRRRDISTPIGERETILNRNRRDRATEAMPERAGIISPGQGGRQAGEQVLHRAKDAGGDGQEDQKNNQGHGDGHTIHSFVCLRYS